MSRIEAITCLKCGGPARQEPEDNIVYCLNFGSNIEDNGCGAWWRQHEYDFLLAHKEDETTVDLPLVDRGGVPVGE